MYEGLFKANKSLTDNWITYFKSTSSYISTYKLIFNFLYFLSCLNHKSPLKQAETCYCREGACKDIWPNLGGGCLEVCGGKPQNLLPSPFPAPALTVESQHQRKRREEKRKMTHWGEWPAHDAAFKLLLKSAALVPKCQSNPLRLRR